MAKIKKLYDAHPDPRDPDRHQSTEIKVLMLECAVSC